MRPGGHGRPIVVTQMCHNAGDRDHWAAALSSWFREGGIRSAPMRKRLNRYGGPVLPTPGRHRPSGAPTLGELPELVRLSQNLVTRLLKRRREIIIGYRRQRPADATLDRVDGSSARPAGLDDADGGLHFGFGHSTV